MQLKTYGDGVRRKPPGSARLMTPTCPAHVGVFVFRTKEILGVIYLHIAVGGALGSIARYTLGGVVQRYAGGVFPWGTLLINVTGSLLLGFIVQYFSESAAVSSESRAFLSTGLLGGYTTFSAFSYEAVRLMEGGNYRGAALYIGTSVLMSLAATICGIEAARELLAARRTV